MFFNEAMVMMKNWHTINSKLVTAQVLLVLIVASVLGIIGYFSMSTYMENTQQKELKDRATALAAVAHIFFKDRSTALSRLAQGTVVEKYSETGNASAILEYFSSFRGTFPSISFTDREGWEVVDTLVGESYNKRRSIVSSPLYISAAKEPNRVHFGKPRSSEKLGGLVLDFGYRYTDYFDENLGFTVATFPLAALSSSLLDVFSKEKGSLIILDDDGNIVYGSEYGQIGQHIHSIDEHIDHRILHQSGDQLPPWGLFNLFGADHIIASAKIPGLSWQVLVVVPVEVYYLPLRDFRDISLLVTLFTAVIVAFLSYYFASSISSPIKDLTLTTQRISSGDLTAISNIKQHDEIGVLSRSINIMTDSLKIAQDRILETNKYLDNIVESMADLLVVIDDKGLIKTANNASFDLLGYSSDQLIGENVEVIVEGGRIFQNFEYSELLKKGTISGLEKLYIAKDGQKIPVLLSGAVLRNEVDKIQGVVCVAQDISKRKKDEQDLKRYAKVLEETKEESKSFAYIVSHDLRAPLVNIRGFSGELNYSIEELKKICEKYQDSFTKEDNETLDEILDTDMREAMEFIGSSITRMDSQINGILKIARLGQRELHWETVDMYKLTNSLFGSFHHQLEDNQIRIKINKLPRVYADRVTMEQVLGNLLDNAVKYSPSGRPGEIEVSSEFRSDEVLFHVKDNGGGIAEQNLSKVFDLFKRVDTKGEAAKG